MKTLKTLTTAVLLTGMFTVSQALTPSNVSSVESRKELQSSLTDKISQSELTWDEQKNTEVVAEIRVSNEGRPEIVAINGDDTYRKLVEEKLKTMKLDKESLYGKTFVCRFKFRKS
jgi:hypothetical protein